MFGSAAVDITIRTANICFTCGTGRAQVDGAEAHSGYLQ